MPEGNIIEPNPQTEPATEKRPLTYSGADVLEYLSLADPSIVGIERIIRSIRQASAGVPKGRVVALNFAQWWWCEHLFMPVEIEVCEQVDIWWDENLPADDLRELAREQAKRHRELAPGIDDTIVHRDIVNEWTSMHIRIAEDLEEWASRPREDVLAKCEAECTVKPWPKRLVYEQKHGAKNARFFLKQRPWKTVSSNGDAYSFRGGFWHLTNDAELAAEVRGTDPVDVLDVDHVAKIVKGVHQLSDTPAKPFEWIETDGNEPKPADLALFRNGLLNVEAGELIQHDGRYFATGLPSHDWDPFEDCPIWMQWLDETIDASYHETLQEWFGYCLTPDVRAHKFAVFLGGPRCGKSTAHSVLSLLLGESHAGSVTMGDLSGEFGLENLLDKRLVVIPDAHDAPIRNRSNALERIKSITGADPISVNRKNKIIVTATLKARLLMTCNKMPKFIDESGALAARMLIVRFDRSFLGCEDTMMLSKLQSEMSGIANWALHGLHRLRENDMHFTVGDAGREAAAIATRSQSPALRFAEARLVVTGNDDDFTPLRDVHQAYLDWAGEESMQRSEIRNQNDLAQDLCAAIPGVRQKQRRIGGKPTYGLRGVASANLAFE